MEFILLKFNYIDIFISIIFEFMIFIFKEKEKFDKILFALMFKVIIFFIIRQFFIFILSKINFFIKFLIKK